MFPRVLQLPTMLVAWMRTQTRSCRVGPGYAPAGPSHFSDLVFLLISKGILEEKGKLFFTIFLLWAHASVPPACCVTLGRLLNCSESSLRITVPT